MSTLDTIVGVLYWLGARSRPGSRWWNRVRRLLLPRLDGWARRRWDRPLVREKTDRGEERVSEIRDTVANVERQLHAAGYRRNLPSTLKYIEGATDRRYEVASWVLHDEAVQYHAWLFELGSAAGDERVAVYQHREDSYLADPKEHETHAGDPDYEPGDPDGTLPEF